jgi:16S rRNA processing protein RimM
MNTSDNILFGKIIKTHGVKGELLVEVFSDSPGDYQDLESVFVEIKQKQIPFFLTSFQPTNQQKVIVAFEDVESVKQAEPLVGSAIFIPQEEILAIDEGRFYYQQMMGYQFEDITAGALGVLDNFIQKNGQDLLIMLYKNAEVYIPVAEQIILDINHKNKTIRVNLPEGLVDLYVQNTSHADKDDGFDEGGMDDED